MGLLDGKKVLITGARKGIGRGIAITLAKEGADVGLNDIVDDEVSQKCVEIVSKHGVKATFHKGDVSKIDDINSVFDSFINSHKKIDVLINNAIFPDQQRPFFETDEKYWDRMMDLSLKGYFFASQRAAKEMINNNTGGRIICLSSVHSYVAMPNWTAYGTAKMALRRMVKGIAADLAGKNITANCIAPGWIETSMTDKLSEDVKNQFLSQIPVGRIGSAKDIANTAVFLSSDEAGYITGQTITVDGGRIIN